jgi:NAD+ synthase
MTLPSIDATRETGRITTFIRDTFKRTGMTTAIVAVSGGIDSATTLALTTAALSPKKVIALHLPAKSTDPRHTHDANLLTQKLHLPHANVHLIRIDSIIQKTWRIISHYAPNHPTPEKNTPDRKPGIRPHTTTNRLRLANLAARIRMLIIYDQAKKHHALVVGTENHSEHLLGYYTRFGDEASDLEPIKHLYKTQVIKLAQHLDLPQEIIDKPPTAGLWPGQTDAQELGFSYETADPILYLHQKGQSRSDLIKAGFDKNLVESVLSQVEATGYKHHVPYTLK